MCHTLCHRLSCVTGQGGEEDHLCARQDPQPHCAWQVSRLTCYGPGVYVRLQATHGSLRRAVPQCHSAALCGTMPQCSMMPQCSAVSQGSTVPQCSTVRRRSCGQAQCQVYATSLCLAHEAGVYAVECSLPQESLGQSPARTAESLVVLPLRLYCSVCCVTAVCCVSVCVHARVFLSYPSCVVALLMSETVLSCGL